jgi:hypothetical protein
MIVTEAPGRDPLDVAADEAAEIMTDRLNLSMGWSEYVAALGKAAEKSHRKHLLAQRLQAAFAADGGQLPLIPDARLQEPKHPRAKRRVLMHKDGKCFICLKCHETAPVPDEMTEAARKRGIPCPRCNQDQPGIAQDENTASVSSDDAEAS